MPPDDGDARPRVELFTDGSCSGNPGPGGWAYILRHPDSGREVEACDGERRTTNNRMELLAVINGLRQLDSSCRVDLYSDSQYVVKGLKSWLEEWKAKGWRRGRRSPVKNLELWKLLDELRGLHDVNPVWVRAHSDHPENERCDRLAVQAAEQFRDG